MLLGLFVDDMFIGKLMARIDAVKNFLNSRLKMKDLGAATILLGMEIRRLPRGDIQLLREKNLGEVLLKCPVTSSRAASTPLPLDCKLNQQDAPQTAKDRAKMEGIPYKSAIGSLMF